jgi:hypothetical protein
MVARRWWTYFVFPWLTIVGCSSSDGRPPPFELSWTSEHFVVHARSDDAAMNAGVLDYLEGNAALIAREKLGLASGSWGPVHYFKYRDEADLIANGPCPGGASACNMHYLDSGRIEVHSPGAVDEHELVHAYAFSLGYPPPLLTEGLAVALSCSPDAEAFDGSTRVDLPASWTDVYDFSGADAHQYLRAGMFTTWLIDHVGYGRVLDLYRALTNGTDAPSFAATFQTIIGMSPDDAWLALSTAPVRRACLNVASCTALDPSTNLFEREVPAAPVPPLGLLVRSLGWPSPAVRPCSTDAAVSTDILWPDSSLDGPSSALFLPNRGDYVLSSVDLSLAPPSPHGGMLVASRYVGTPLGPTAVGSSCAGLEPIPMQDQMVNVRVWPRSGPVVFGLRSGMGPSAAQTVLAHPDRSGVDAPFSVEICDSCTSGTLNGCKALQQGAAAMALAAASPWFRVQWNPPEATSLLTITFF